MSVDLSDPQITAAREAIADPSNPTCWFILHYATSSSHPAISLLQSGEAPVVDAWQTVLGETQEEVLFGYGEIKGKGLVLVFLRDNVGGVRRARAVVHSRAIAALFPDYSALITIAHPSQLTDDLVINQLGLHMNQNLNQNQNQSAIQPPPRQASLVTRPSNAQRPNAQPSNTQISFADPNLSPAHSSAVAQSSAAAQSAPPLPQQTQPQPLVHRPSHTSTPSKASIGRDERDIPAESPQSTSKYQGISSADYFKEDASRARKTSLTSRFRNTFQRSASSDEPTSPSNSNSFNGQPSSPASPASTSGRFKSSSLAKAFGRRRSEANGNETTPPTSPKLDEFGRGGYGGMEDLAPPVPPKDVISPPMMEGSAAQSRATLGHEEHQPSRPNPQSQSSALSPSPSARQALFDARQKSLSNETAIQERFRRDQEDRARRDGQDEDDDDDQSVRLAYDESDNEDALSPQSNVAMKSPVDANHEVHTATFSEFSPITPQIHQNGGSVANEVAVDAAPPIEDLRIEDDRQQEDERRLDEERRLESERILENERGLENERRLENERLIAEEEKLEAERRAVEERAAAQKAEEQRIEAQRRELEQIRMEAEAEQRAKQEVEAQAKREEVERLRLEAEERARIEAENQEKLRLEEEARQEGLRLEEEARQREEEERRRVAEEEERARLEEEERMRILEEERLRREELARIRREEEERENARVEAEAKKRQDVRDQLEKGKRDGGVMLRGWVTAQTFKSMTWRRRYFHLLSTEMQLFKAEGDAKPIQTVYFGSSSTISENYEDSQVKDSFKVISDGPKGEEEFFLFTDSPEDKETVLAGMRMCL